MRILLAMIIALAVAWAGYWFIGSSALKSGVAQWFDARQADGQVAEYGALRVQGFPNRFDTSFTDLALGDPATGWIWQAPFFQLLTLSYRPNHVIAVWPHEQHVGTPRGDYLVTSNDMRASLVVDANTDLGLKRSTLTATGIALTPEDGSGPISAAILRLAAERLDAPAGSGEAGAPGDPRYHLGLAAEGLAPPAALMADLAGDGGLARVIDTLTADLTAAFDAPWDRHVATGMPPQPTQIDVAQIAARWGSVSFDAAGRLDIGGDGRPVGTIDVAVRNWRDLLDALRAMDALDPDTTASAERALSMLSSLSGDPKVLNVPLRFETGRVWLGPVPIAEAPRLSLR